jgi:hypothetical protein
MADLVAFDSKTPAYLKRARKGNTDLTANVGSGGFPYLSLEGKHFSVVRDKVKNIITKPDDPDEPATALEVVLLKASPSLSRNYYSKGYTKGDSSKPECHSEDSIKPAADAANPQSKACATCPHNVWGGGQGGVGFACRQSRRVAIAPAGQLNDPMLLRVPPGSFKNLKAFGEALDKRGFDYNMVLTTLRFDPNEPSPVLMFKAKAPLTEEEFAQVEQVLEEDIIEQILGQRPVEHTSDADDEEVLFEEGMENAKPPGKAKKETKA